MNMADYEVSYDCVKRASKIVVDNWDTIKHRMVSTVAMMWKDGLVKDEDIHAQLGQILDGKKTGRENDQEIIYFNAVGTGILDLAVTTGAIVRRWKPIRALWFPIGYKVNQDKT